MFKDDLILAVPQDKKPVSLTVPLQKSFVEAHYRHDSKGKLIFVQAYHNKKHAKPEELTASKIGTPLPNAKPTDDSNQKFLSFHKGDEVFAKYSHMHDQHFLLGAVLSIRDDKSHSGKLIAVRLLDGRVEYFTPNSLIHLHKEDADKRTHEKSNYTDDTNNTIDYKHLNPEQKQFFYDQYKLWFRLHRMGELKAFNEHKDLFKLENGKLPTNKEELSAEQKIQLEKLNKFPIVPLDAIREMVSDAGYDKGKHASIAKQLLEDIATMEKEGVPNVQFPKLYKKKGKKENPYAPPEWLSGMFPSVEEEFEGKSSDYEKVMEELHKKLGDLTPSTQGAVHGNYKDFYYGQPLTHGQVIAPKEEGSKYKPAPVLPSPSLSAKDEFWKTVATETVQPKPKKSEGVVVPADKEKQAEAEKALFHDGDVDISDLKFTVTANAAHKGFGGTHSKYIMKDEQGNEYLFKPYNSQEVYRSWVDVIAHKVAKKVGVNTADFGSKPVEINVPSGLGGSYSGKKAIGSVQKIVTNIKANSIGDYSSNGFSTAPKNIIEQLQREHVVDWLLGNNDAHKDQFLIDSDGNIIGVDKGHAFKYYKDDVLSLTYDPANNNAIGNKSVYHTLLNSAKSKKLKLDWNVVGNFINGDLKNLSPTDFANMVLPYATNSVVWKDNPAGLQELAIKRLANVEKDFKSLYKSAGIDVGSDVVSETAKEETPSIYGHQKDAFQQIDNHFHSKVMAAKGLGCSILMGGGCVEDMAVLYTPYTWDFNKPNADHTGKGLEVSFKLMSGHEQNVLSMFDTVEDSDTALVNKKGSLESNFDPYGTVAIAAAKTVNNHCINGGKTPDGKPDEGKMNAFAKHFQGLDKFDKNAPLLSVEDLAHNLSDKYIKSNFFDDHISLSYDVAEHYHKIATETMDAIKANSKTESKLYMPWNGSYTSKTINVSKKKFPHATFPTYHMDDDGNLKRKVGDKSAIYETHGSPQNYGCVFKKQLDGNITVSYYPHYSKDLTGQNNVRSQQGQFVIDFHNWDGNIDSMHKAREVMHKFGIDHKLGTHNDLECLYLTRIAWQNKANIDHKAEYEKIAKMENNEKKVQALKELCNKTYGSMPDSLSSYHPIPKWDDNSGHHYFLNPYVLEHLKTDNNEKFLLKHDIQASKEDAAIESIAKNGLLSIERRKHLGFNYFGMSCTSDQQTGGGSYVFLRGYKPKNGDEFVHKNSMVFRPELWARTDLIPRKNDQFGTTHDTKVDSHGSIHDRVKIMDVMNDKSQHQIYNDVTVKNGLSMTNWLRGIKSGSDYDGDPESEKMYNSWIKQFKNAIIKHKPHVLNHAKFINIS
jgi:tRNA-binding EMAP/Myf-like protein